jgi:ABC-2 type transport system ATP-binding protein
MPDFFGVYEDLLVWEYLDFFARCYGIAPNRRKQVVDELLDLVDLGEKRESAVQALSLGMRQRLCLAHALVHDPQVLLLDEPASGLDPRARVEMRELLKELGSMGKTIVLSSHILAELAELCDSIGIIEKGRLVASGLLEDIRAQIFRGRRLKIRILSDEAAAMAVLDKAEGVSAVQRTDNGNDALHLEMNFSGDAQAAAVLLETLVHKKVRVASFQEAANDLEELFLTLTKGEVA